MKNTTVLTEEEARAAKYRCCCGPYVEKEYWMLQNAINDMRGGKATFAIIEGFQGKELWRK